jgi:hypothetical protein
MLRHLTTNLKMTYDAVSLKICHGSPRTCGNFSDTVVWRAVSHLATGVLQL